MAQGAAVAPEAAPATDGEVVMKLLECLRHANPAGLVFRRRIIFEMWRPTVTKHRGWEGDPYWEVIFPGEVCGVEHEVTFLTTTEAEAWSPELATLACQAFQNRANVYRQQDIDAQNGHISWPIEWNPGRMEL